MRDAAGPLLMIATVILTFVFAYGYHGQVHYSGPYTVTDQQVVRSGLTQRERTLVTFVQEGRKQCNFQFLSYDTSRTFTVELPKGTDLEPGSTYSREEIDELKGRSRLGTAWDFLLTPKKK